MLRNVPRNLDYATPKMLEKQALLPHPVAKMPQVTKPILRLI